MKSHLFALGMVLTFALPALSHAADTAAERKHNQNARIREGYKSGELTWQQANDLRNGERNIASVIKDAKADGTVTADEQAKITTLQNEQSAKIHLLKHDNVTTDAKARAQVRQFNQKERVKDGVADGSLTTAEANKLDAYIQKNHEILKNKEANGLSDHDKSVLEDRQDITSAKIFLQRHDDQVAAANK